MIWVEPFAGSLAVGLRALGQKPLVGWQGGKSGYAEKILEVVGNPVPTEVWCADVTDWAVVWRALARDGVADEARSWLADLAEKERPSHCPKGHPQLTRSLWLEMRDHWRVHGTAETGEGVARWLALVKGSALNKGPHAGCIYGKSATAWPTMKTGQVHAKALSVPMERLPQARLPLRTWDDAHAIPPREGAIVYIDPPYAGTTGYSKDSSFDVPSLVKAWLGAGSTVIVSETRPETGALFTVDLSPHRKAGARVGGSTPEILSVFLPGMSF